MNENIQIKTSIINDKSGQPALICQVSSKSNSNWAWVGGIISDRFTDSKSLSICISDIENLTQNYEPIHITKDQIQSFISDDLLSITILNQLQEDENSSIVAQEDDFLIQKSEAKNAVGLLRLLAFNFPEYGKNIVKITTDIASMVVKQNMAIVVSHTHSFEPFTLESKKLVWLLQEWHKFLVEYELDKIPGEASS